MELLKGTGLTALTVSFLALCVRVSATEIYLDDLDLSNVASGESVYWPQVRHKGVSLKPEQAIARRNTNVHGDPLVLGTNRFERGVGVLANSLVCVETAGKAVSFDAVAGADAVLGKMPYNWVPVCTLQVWADERVVFSRRLSGSSKPVDVHADVKGAKRVYLAAYFSGYQTQVAVDWCEARFTVEEGAQLRTVKLPPARQLGILTPPERAEPRINGPSVFGVRPDHPILYTLPVTGERPMTLSATGLPEGATFDAATGFLRGRVSKAGSYPIRFTATNAKGATTRTIRLEVGDRIALTPPMCWNSWNCFGGSVTAANVRDAADAFVSKGLVNHGWSYVNVDDFWMQSPEKGRKNFGPGRDAQGELLPAGTFGDMKALADYIHAKGLRAGLYSSPGPVTCGRCYGSWQHEVQDATTFAKWGYDFLKYDRCSLFSADDASKPRTERQQRPYKLMGDALRAQNRDIVLDICQYGECAVWAWGAEVGGHMWRTTGDIADAWASCLEIIDNQAGITRYAKPDGWNDPDMMIVGWVGGGAARPTRITANEQYTHVGLWAMMSAPLQIGCDLTKLDAFTLSLLTNDEILAIDLDELGRAAERWQHDDAADVWVKPLQDGSIAVACFNRFFLDRDFKLPLLQLGVREDWRVRCVWAQKDLGVTKNGEWTWTVKAVPPHATMILRFIPPRTWEPAVAPADCPDCPKRVGATDGKDAGK